MAPRLRSLVLLPLLPAVLALPTLPTAPAVAAAPKAPTCDGLRATIVGTPRADKIVGTPGRDVIVGLGGDDVIDGRGGNDVICGGDGADTLTGGRGNDRLFGGNDRVATTPGEGRSLVGDRLDGGDGNDYLDAGLDPRRRTQRLDGYESVSWATTTKRVQVKISDDGSVRATGTTGKDTVVAHPALVVTGTAYADRIIGSERPDLILGGAGADYIEGRGGDDTILPDGVDTSSVAGIRDDKVFAGRGNDLVIALAGLDLIKGGDGNDTLQAGVDASVLRGEGGRDTLTATLNDQSRWSLEGGTGIDSLTLRGGDDLSPDSLLTIDQSTGKAGLGAVDAAPDFTGSVTGIESLNVRADVTLDYVGLEVAETLRAIGQITARMRGGDDTVFGSPLDDVVDGGAGEDTVRAGDGDDLCPNTEVAVSCDNT